MTVRARSILVLAAVLALPAAFAQSTVFVGGEAGWVDQPVQSTVTRAQLTQQFVQSRATAVPQGGSRFVGGEAGWVDQPVRSSVTGAQVTREFLQSRANAVAPDGSRYVGGEAGYVYVFQAPQYASKDARPADGGTIASTPTRASVR